MAPAPPGLGEMLAGGSPEEMGLPPPGAEGEMGPAPQEGMSMEDAIGVMQKYQIPPEAFPEIAGAVFTIIDSQGGGGEEPPPEMMPPGGPGGGEGEMGPAPTM